MLTLWDSPISFSLFADECIFERISNEALDIPPRAGRFTPAVDLFDDKLALIVKAELPGMKVEDVGIDVEKGVLTLRGKRELEKREEGSCRIERAYGTFSRSFVLPDTVDPERIQASLSDGILTVSLSKKPASLPRKIDIKVS
jgi:HSP20 family protein